MSEETTVVETIETPITLKQAVANAAQTLSSETENSNESSTENEVSDKKTEKSTVKAEKVDKQESKSDEVGSTTSDVEIAETPEQLAQALNLYRTLIDPASAKDFVAKLAKDVGLEIKGSETTVKEVTKSVVEQLKTALGEENEDLALRLAPVFENLLKDAVKPTESLRLETQIKEAKQEVDDTFSKLSLELPDFDALASKMDEVMKEMAPAKGVSMEKYLRQIYKLAGGTEKTKDSEKTSSKTSEKTSAKNEVKKVINKITQNAKETKQNVSSDVEESRITNALERPTVKQAVMMAVKELQGKT